MEHRACKGRLGEGAVSRIQKRLRRGLAAACSCLTGGGGEGGARLFRGAQGWDERQQGHVGTQQLLTRYKEKKFLLREWSKEGGRREAMRSQYLLQI